MSATAEDFARSHRIDTLGMGAFTAGTLFGVSAAVFWNTLLALLAAASFAIAALIWSRLATRNLLLARDIADRWLP